MHEGFRPERTVRDEGSVETFRLKLDRIITDEEAGHGFTQNAYQDFIRDINVKRAEFELGSGEDAGYAALALEAERRMLAHRSGQEA